MAQLVQRSTIAPRVLVSTSGTGAFCLGIRGLADWRVVSKQQFIIPIVETISSDIYIVLHSTTPRNVTEHLYRVVNCCILLHVYLCIMHVYHQHILPTREGYVEAHRPTREPSHMEDVTAWSYFPPYPVMWYNASFDGTFDVFVSGRASVAFYSQLSR